MAEADSLDAAKIALESLYGVSFGSFQRLDTSGAEGPNPEGFWSVNDSSTRFYIEHTTIEVFEGQREIAAQFDEMRSRILPQLHRPNPDSRLEVRMTTEFLQRSFRGDFRAHKDDVVQQINAIIAAITPGQVISHSFDRWRTTLSVESRTYYNPGTGYLHLVPIINRRQASTRLERFQRALEEKCPKLLRYQSSTCTTVLILEDVDPFNSTFENFREMFDTVSYARDQLPEVILYAQIDLSGSIAEICEMKVGDQWFLYPETQNYLREGN
jgi:hypothetical protein